MDLGLKDKVIIAKVMAAYHSDDEKAHKTQELIRAEGGEYELCKADCSTEEGVDAVCRAALEKYGRIDAESVRAVLEKEVGAVFLRVLEDAGVYKRTQAGRAALGRFLEKLK